MAEIEKNGDKIVVHLDKNLVASELPEIKEMLQKILADEPQFLTIELGQVTMLDSMGIGVLIATHNSLQKRGVQLELTSVSSDIKKILTTMRLLNHFKVTD